MQPNRYAKNAGAVCSLSVHIVFCPKYRRSVLVNPVDVRLKELLTEKTAELDLAIRALEVMPDHVHLFIDFDPRWGIAEIVNRLKGYTSRQLRIEFPALKSRLPTLWSRSYFAATTGCVSDKAIERYITEQKGK